MVLFAHSRNASGIRHDLVAHLRDVAQRAAGFAADLQAEQAGYYLGLWHDLGKFNPQWQRYLLDSEAGKARRGSGPDHKAAGAHLTWQILGPLALLVQAHHGGLKTVADLKKWLQERTKDPDVEEALRSARQAITDLIPATRPPLPEQIQHGRHGQELFLRLLFSALVDADFLDTESHLRVEDAAERRTGVPLTTLWERFQEHRNHLAAQPAGHVNQLRNEIYAHCFMAAASPPGIFRLAVPTGGGKTLSAMGFALRHALRYDQRRIIVAVPFISITEQTADVYRRLLERAGDGRAAVLEHHSGATHAVGDDKGDGEEPVTEAWRRLAAENWDAPVVVTTTVQLFESLFAASTSATRKLHRLARSVIILDEAQALPARLLEPILDVLRTLAKHYGTTVVISTATQPAFEVIPLFREGTPQDIVPDSSRYFTALRRVAYEWQVEPPVTWANVAAQVRGERQALVVVNTKRDALALLDAVESYEDDSLSEGAGDGAVLHLSTLLCGAHRRQVITEVQRRLRAGEPCYLISTQVIEAGVDLDFPAVFRALGPLDSVIQAAGRCNREGKLASLGRMVVFKPVEGGLPQGGAYQMATGITESLLGAGHLDPNDPAQSRRFFELLFDWLGPDGTDAAHIQELRKLLDYPEVAKRFRMIDGPSESVAVTTFGTQAERDTVRSTLDKLGRGDGNVRELVRSLQPYLVSVYSYESKRYLREQLISPVLEGLGEWQGKYDEVRGLVAEHSNLEALVV